MPCGLENEGTREMKEEARQRNITTQPIPTAVAKLSTTVTSAV
jgi:hypothetical protein